MAVFIGATKKPTNALYQIMESLSTSELKKMYDKSKMKLEKEKNKKNPSKRDIQAFKNTQSYIKDILARR